MTPSRHVFVFFFFFFSEIIGGARSNRKVRMTFPPLSFPQAGLSTLLQKIRLDLEESRQTGLVSFIPPGVSSDPLPFVLVRHSCNKLLFKKPLRSGCFFLGGGSCVLYDPHSILHTFTNLSCITEIPANAPKWVQKKKKRKEKRKLFFYQCLQEGLEIEEPRGWVTCPGVTQQ